MIYKQTLQNRKLHDLTHLFGFGGGVDPTNHMLPSELHTCIAHIYVTDIRVYFDTLTNCLWKVSTKSIHGYENPMHFHILGGHPAF